MHPRTLGALALAVVSFVFSPAARADVLDQSYLGGPPGVDGSVDANATFTRGQTFTVGQTGTLSRVMLPLARNATVEGDSVTIDVRPTDETGAPLLEDGTALASVVFPSAAVPEIMDFGNLFEVDVSGAAIPVTEGDVLAIVARSDVPFGQGRQFAIGAVIGGEYADGAAWIRSTGAWALQEQIPTDWGFETYVEVPEPAGAALAVVALATVIGVRARVRSRG
jgi:hypothetical protein